ncbi:DUF6262 family protein [Nocardia sp. NPDC060249]|uniref:DUF6262 family protein n=1 Tax=Nocardia sp. NPDC060249 TaxID=3347082 RepID=UPI0036689DE5
MAVADRAERTRRLIDARRRDSTAKHERALAAVADLLAAGERITISEVARRAAVSTWFIYNTTAVHDAVQAAIAQQVTTSPSPRRGATTNASAEGLRTELLLARDEIRSLRAEREQLSKKVQLLLGGQLEQVPHERLVERIHELERIAADLRSQVETERDRADTATGRAAALDEELLAARTALKRMMQTASPSRQTGQDRESDSA